MRLLRFMFSGFCVFAVICYLFHFANKDADKHHPIIWDVKYAEWAVFLRNIECVAAQ